MKSKIFKSTALALSLTVPMSVMAVESSSQKETISNPIEAVVQIPIAGIRFATGAIALPFMFVGEVGELSGRAGETLWQHANRSDSKEMHTSDAKVTANPNERFL